MTADTELRRTGRRARGTVAVGVAFALTVMADRVSSTAYAIEAALAGLDGDPASLTLTMAAVVVVIALVAVGYHGIIGRFPGGGGGAEAIAAGFGEGSSPSPRRSSSPGHWACDGSGPGDPRGWRPLVRRRRDVDLPAV